MLTDLGQWSGETLKSYRVINFMDFIGCLAQIRHEAKSQIFTGE